MQRSHNPAFPVPGYLQGWRQLLCRGLLAGIINATSVPIKPHTFNVIHYQLLLTIQEVSQFDVRVRSKGGGTCHIERVPGYRRGACCETGSVLRELPVKGERFEDSGAQRAGLQVLCLPALLCGVGSHSRIPEASQNPPR